MSNREDNNTFLDPKTIMAIVLVGLVWFGWQTYLGKKYPAATKSTSPVEQTQQPTETKSNAGIKTNEPMLEVVEKAKIPVQDEKLIAYENSKISFQLSSEGMGFKKVILKNHFDREHKPMVMGVSETTSLFKVSEIHSEVPLIFTITKKGDHVFEGVANTAKTKITRTIEINPETEAIKNTIRLQGNLSDFPGIAVWMVEKEVVPEEGNFLIPSFDHQEIAILHSGSEERINSSTATEKIDKEFANVSMASIGSQYFTTALVDKSVIIPEVRVLAGKNQAEISAVLNYKVKSDSDNLELAWISYAGPKSLLNLEKIDKDLAKTVDLGFFSQIGRVLLILLKWFHSVFGNWGVAIILLTLLVRTLVLPLNITTFRSTKKMQKLQPLIAALRERYKDDAPTMNREMMALWKEHKVNPVGGCLPMLLQLPIFFALYRILGQSIELYQVPFFGWIHDLSLKDPYYILPLLMGICMFIQQKITPTTMDPTQTKIMQFLPIVFSFMMISLPAGLTLYIFINTLAGILLQQLFMHDRSTVSVTNAVKA